MKYLRKVVAAVLTVCVLITLLAACGSTSAQPKSGVNSSANMATSRKITDPAGNTVEIPANVKSVSITSAKGAFELFTLLGHEDKVISTVDTSNYLWLRKLYPNLATMPNYGSFDNVNVEELLKADPDIVFSPQLASKANEKMKSLGMTVYIDGVTSKGDPYEGRDTELRSIAEIIGETDKANAYLNWEKKWLNLVAERVKNISESERKTVLCLRTKTTEVFNEQNILGYSVSLAGGINVAKDAFSNKFYNDVGAEKIVKWNPDFIFQYAVNANGKQLVTRFDEMKADPRFKGMSVLDSGNFYIMPYGLTNWGSKIETSLGVLTMAKTMYPDKFADISIKKVAKEFYSKFLGHELDDTDWSLITNTANGANSLPLN